MHARPTPTLLGSLRERLGLRPLAVVEQRLQGECRSAQRLVMIRIMQQDSTHLPVGLG